MQPTDDQSLFSWREIALLLLFCLVIAIFLNLVSGNGLGYNLVFAETIGISIYTTIKALIRIRHCSKDDFLSYLIGIPVGSLIGVIIGALLTDTRLTLLIGPDSGIRQKAIVIPLFAALLFGIVISWFFHSREKLARQALQLQEDARQRSEHERHLAETQLRLLQAQIEPHFLFNALANVISLIDNDPESARKVLENLSEFLRTSLSRTRQPHTTIRDEIKLLTAYLNIQQVRMGERLHFHIDCAEEMLSLKLPPLLVQPLVENAVRHGLENTVTGGAIQITFTQENQQIHIVIVDNGKGMADSGKTGTGLTNIRSRLQAIYGAQATLSLVENDCGGVTAALVLPATSTETS